MTKIKRLIAASLGLLAAGCSQLPSKFVTDSLPERGKKRGLAERTMDELFVPDELLCFTSPEAVDLYQLAETVDLWDRMREGFALPAHRNKRVEQQLALYSRHPDYMSRVAQRGLPYLHYIVEQLDARGMPMEFALLPIVESAFDPFAYSHGRASGMWQFVPGTGKWLGLKQNWWYDGRRDVVASTDAALRYLENLHKAFGDDWLLALAAYNAGRGNVSKAIRQNKAQGKPIDFWSLNLPKETQAYVPRLLALRTLVTHPEQYNISLMSVPDQPYFTAIDVGSQIDLAHAAELADMTMENFYLLNPAFNRWATDPEGPHTLLVPLDRAESFRAKLAEVPKEERVTWDRYQIKPGDTLSTIAARYKTSVDGLKAVNGLRSNKIRQGDVLMVPMATQDTSHYAFSAEQRLKKTHARTAQKADGHKVSYKVQSGDSFWTISRRYKVSVRELAKWNGMAPGDPLRIGQELAIWTKDADKVPDTASQGVVRKVAYSVRQGDSLSRIATRFRVSVGDIQRWNDLSAAKYLQPGQALTLYVDVTNR